MSKPDNRTDKPELRILVLSPWGAGGGYSGPLTFMNRLFSAAKERHGYVRIDLLYRDRGQEVLPDWADHSSVGVRSRAFGRFAQARWMMGAAVTVLRQRHRVDVIHLHGTYLTNMVPALFARSRQLVLLPVLEGGDLAVRRSARLKSWIVRRAVKKAAVAYALSGGIANELVGVGLSSSRITRIANPVSDEMLRRPVREKAPSQTLRVGFVGKIGPLKNPHLLIEAARELVSWGHDVEVHYFGPFASKEMELSMRLTLEKSPGVRAMFHGLQPDMIAAFDALDVFVLPSSHEGLPGSLMEAFARGRPAVVTDVGSMGEYVRLSGAGVVVEPDAASLARGIAELARPEEWLLASANGRRFAEGWLHARNVASVYLSMIGSGTDAS